MKYLVLIFAVILISCSHQNPRTRFTRLGEEETGIHFRNANMEDESYNVLVYEYFYNGGGVAIGDINNDGLADIYFSGNQLPNRLYLNKGNLKFEDITQLSGTAAKDGWKTGVAMADVNADGLLDIYVCRSAANKPEQRENSLFINNGDLTFTDKAKEFGLDDNSYSTQASFFDYDRDGDLDMFLLNHSVSSIVRNYDIRTESKTDRVPYVGNKLYENSHGKFIDVSDEKGINGPAHNYGLGICISDINNDGWLDLYASNDYTGADYLLLNKLGKFENVADSLLTHISRFSMGVDIADVNNDGYTDIYTLDMLPDNNKRQKELFWPDQYDIQMEMVKNGLHHQYMRNMLHLNNGGGVFSEIGQLAGISNTDWSWSALFADYDNDGLQDLFVSNGYKRDYTNNDFLKYRADQMRNTGSGKAESYVEMIEKMPSNKLSNYVFNNRTGLLFSDSSTTWGFSDKLLTHGAAYGDLDNDGDLDLVLNNMDDVASVYRNNTQQQDPKNYLKIKLKGNDNNKAGLGASVKVYSHGKFMMRELNPYRGFQSSVEPLLYFGLGENDIIDSIVVRWPKGEIQKIAVVKCNQQIEIDQRLATLKLKEAEKSETLFIDIDNKIYARHEENDFIDFKVQPLLQRMYSREGPAFTHGDVNGDGLIDLYLGGAKDQKAQLFLKCKDNSYYPQSIAVFENDANSEDVDATFFDKDNDGDLDLYVVTGGYEFASDSPLLVDKLYENDGRGNFKKCTLPDLFAIGSCVRAHDVDFDGDTDLFVGTRIISGRYPLAPISYLLLNDGKGNFSVDGRQIASGVMTMGMVTDAAWCDLDSDKNPELIVVGEWMEIQVFVNNKGTLINKTNEFVPPKTNGYWNKILPYDFDKDGDDDLVISNHGINNQIKPTVLSPATLYVDDFDKNGSIDPILSYYIQKQSYPFPTRDELAEQLPALKKKFPNFASYANSTIYEVLTKEQIQQAAVLQAFQFETTYFENSNGKLIAKPLPVQLQFSPVQALAVADINMDGNADLLTGGGISATRARTGMLKGNTGFVFLGDGKGNFIYLPQRNSGLHIREDVKHLFVDNNVLFVVTNDGPIHVFKFKNSL